eukprot:759337-Hanusia_phi.AAC.1
MRGVTVAGTRRSSAARWREKGNGRRKRESGERRGEGCYMKCEDWRVRSEEEGREEKQEEKQDWCGDRFTESADPMGGSRIFGMSRRESTRNSRLKEGH